MENTPRNDNAPVATVQQQLKSKSSYHNKVNGTLNAVAAISSLASVIASFIFLPVGIALGACSAVLWLASAVYTIRVKDHTDHLLKKIAEKKQPQGREHNFTPTEEVQKEPYTPVVKSLHENHPHPVLHPHSWVDSVTHHHSDTNHTH